MANLYLLQSGRTQWCDSNRFASAAGVPLSEAGEEAIRKVAVELADRPIKAIYAPPCESERQTAQIVGKLLKLRWHCREGLRELDYGLWQGLLLEEVKKRYGKVYRQWREAPTSANPPGGETFTEAQERICKTVAGILKRHRGEDVLLILQPVAVALVKCRLTGADASAVWGNVDMPETWTCYKLDGFGPMEISE
ncbi:MAG: histidine phosphatase family protein [Planctomycetes bacterium]|nr:histidine phosphatase family protein [Planctomycetota bacterium]